MKEATKPAGFILAFLASEPRRMLWVHIWNAAESYYQWIVERYYQFSAISEQSSNNCVFFR